MAVAVEPAALPVSRRSTRSARSPATTTSSRCATRSSTTARPRSPRSSSCAGREPRAPAFLLESAEQGQRVGRYSFIGVRPRRSLRWSLGDEGDPYALAAPRSARYRQAPLPDLPPFAGGAVGYFGYDLVRTVEPLGEPNPDVLGLPDMALMLTDVLVVFDHLKHTITILVNVYAEDAAPTSSAPTPTRARRSRRRGALLAGPGAAATATPTPARARPEFASNMPREQFEAMVARIVEYVHAGDAFQVVPSPALVAPTSTSTRSRSTAGCGSSTRARTCTSWTSATSRSPAPSPEPLLTVTGRHVSTRPIAGTRPRGADAGRGRADRRGAARRREGARRARDARRPRAQRPRPRLRVRHGQPSTRSWRSRPTRT